MLHYSIMSLEITRFFEQNPELLQAFATTFIARFEIDISGLNEVGDSIHVRDLKLGEEIVIINDPEEVIARISQPAAAAGEVEIIKKCKADEEEED